MRTSDAVSLCNNIITNPAHFVAISSLLQWGEIDCSYVLIVAKIEIGGIIEFKVKQIMLWRWEEEQDETEESNGIYFV